jgi:hypothetical protein
LLQVGLLYQHSLGEIEKIRNELHNSHVRFEVFTAAKTSMLFSAVTPSGLVGRNQSLGKTYTYCLHLQS